MSDDICARDVIFLHDARNQGHERFELCIVEFAIAISVAGMVELDTDAGRIHILVSAPVGYACMPGALFLRHQPYDLTLFADQVMRRNLGFRIAQPFDGEPLVLHFGVMDDQHGNGSAAFVMVRRKDLPVDEFVLAGWQPVADLAEIGVQPIIPSPCGRTAPSTNASAPL